MKHNSFFKKSDPPYVIAELGSYAPYEHLTKIIDTVAEAGVDAVKFQWFNASELTPYNDSRYAMYTRCEWNEWQNIQNLIHYAHGLALDVGCSFFSIEAVRAYGDRVDFIKIASPESTWTALIEEATKIKPVLISVPEDISDCYKQDRKGIDTLYCPMGYPSQVPDKIWWCDGISDHSLGFEALKLKPKIIEKHFGSSEGPNGPVNMHPDNAKMFVDIAHDRYQPPKPTKTRTSQDGFRYRPPVTEVIHDIPEHPVVEDLPTAIATLLKGYDIRKKAPDETE